MVSRANSLVVQNQTTPATFSQYGSSLAVPLAIGAHRYRQRIYVAENGTAQGSRPAVPTLRVLETISTVACSRLTSSKLNVFADRTTIAVAQLPFSPRSIAVSAEGLVFMTGFDSAAIYVVGALLPAAPHR